MADMDQLTLLTGGDTSEFLTVAELLAAGSDLKAAKIAKQKREAHQQRVFQLWRDQAEANRAEARQCFGRLCDLTNDTLTKMYIRSGMPMPELEPETETNAAIGQSAASQTETENNAAVSQSAVSRTETEANAAVSQSAVTKGSKKSNKATKDKKAIDAKSKFAKQMKAMKA